MPNNEIIEELDAAAAEAEESADLPLGFLKRHSRFPPTVSEKFAREAAAIQPFESADDCSPEVRERIRGEIRSLTRRG